MNPLPNGVEWKFWLPEEDLPTAVFFSPSLLLVASVSAFVLLSKASYLHYSETRISLYSLLQIKKKTRFCAAQRLI
jgi:hypothetical protein